MLSEDPFFPRQSCVRSWHPRLCSFFRLIWNLGEGGKMPLWIKSGRMITTVPTFLIFSTAKWSPWLWDLLVSIRQVRLLYTHNWIYMAMGKPGFSNWFVCLLLFFNLLSAPGRTRSTKVFYDFVKLTCPCNSALKASRLSLRSNSIAEWCDNSRWVNWHFYIRRNNFWD